MHAPTPTMGLTLLFFLITVTAAVGSRETYIKMLRPHSGSGNYKLSDLNCLSWRLAVETNNLRKWSLVPQACGDYVGDYMLGIQYPQDCDLVAAEAYEYASGLTLTGDGKDVWVFDVHETSLSNLPYYTRDTVEFGALPYNSTAFNEWVDEARAPAVPASLKLYKKLIELGFKIVFLSGTHEEHREAFTKNLKAVGYTTWEKLILKGENEGSSAVYKPKKRKELEEAGYKIRGNFGDQWGDLLGTSSGDRTFKLPNPMYASG